MPRASDSRATPLTIGVWRIWRRANLRSRPSEDTNPMAPWTAGWRLRFAKKCSRLPFTFLESQAGPSVVDRADLEIHPPRSKTSLADEVAVQLRSDARSFLRPRQPQRLATCPAEASRRRIGVAHGQQMRLEFRRALGKADINVSIGLGPRGEFHVGGKRLQRVGEPPGRSEERDLDPRLDAELRDRWLAPGVVVWNHRVVDGLCDRLRQRRLDAAPGGEGGVRNELPRLVDFLALAVHEHERHVTRRLGAAHRMLYLAAARGKARQIDHIGVGHSRFDLTADQQAIAEIKIDLKAKSLELLLSPEALVFLPVHKAYVRHAADSGSRLPVPGFSSSTSPSHS